MEPRTDAPLRHAALGVACLAATLLALPGVALAQAPAPPPGPAPAPVSSYCSPSGDICTRVSSSGGRIYFSLRAANRYFARHRICVSGPSGRACRSFALRRVGRVYGTRVRWDQSFPARRTGAHRVAWSVGGRRLGPALQFIIR